MLIDDKITLLLAGESACFNNYSDKLNQSLAWSGLTNTKNLIVTDILYYLLQQNFSHDNINFELYKRLNHLSELFAENPLTTTPPVSTPSTTPVITLSVGDLDFGVVLLTESSTLSVTFSAVNLSTFLTIIAPTNYTISLDPNHNFKSGIIIIPDSDGEIVTTTLYIKYTPTSKTTDTSDLTFSTTGISSEAIELTGIGVDNSVSPETFALDVINSPIEVELSFNHSWTLLATYDVTMLTPDVSSGTAGNTTVTFTVALNDDPYPKVTALQFSSDSIIYDVTITQEGYILTLDPATYSIGGGGGTFDVEVTSNIPWSASGGTMSYAPNTGTAGITVVTVTVPAGGSDTLTGAFEYETITENLVVTRTV